MIAPLFAVALQLQRLGVAPIATAADLDHAHVRIDADHVPLETLLERIGDAFGVPVAIRRGEAAEISESVIANDVEVAPLLGMLETREPIVLGTGAGAPVLTAEYFPTVSLGAETNPVAERCRVAKVDERSVVEHFSGWLRPAPAPQSVSDMRLSLDLEACPVERLGERMHELLGVRVVVAQGIAGVQITTHATDTAADLFFESLRRVAGVRVESSIAGIATLAMSADPHRRPGWDYWPAAAIPREATIFAPDPATAAALEPVLSRYLSHFGTLERRGSELHVVDDEENLSRLRNLTDAWVKRGWRP